MIKDIQVNGHSGDLLQIIEPRKTFADVILPEKTRRALADTLIQIEKHNLIFDTWGFGERHATGIGLVFNFTGPPGTGKTICAEAVANLLSKRLLSVRYSELESCWAGETSKNLVSVFREARRQDVVLFFDEADSIASRRFINTSLGYEREANQGVNILLKELEYHDGVVIFATNLWTNFDPAFQRRIRTHIVFELPGPRERKMIWMAQLHPTKSPLADDVDFDALAERFELSGGDIKNAVLKAAHMAAAAEGLDYQKKITQANFETAALNVLESKRAMKVNPDDTAEAEPSAIPAKGAVLPRDINSRLDSIERENLELRRQMEDLKALLKQGKVS